jgi:two-component system sensor histidine kinase GlrK
MSVATKLRGAFALYIALLAAVLVYHVRTVQRTVASGHALAEISERLSVTSTGQIVRIAQMGSDAEKYLVTRDRGYLDKIQQTARDYGNELRRFEGQPLDAGERMQVAPLAADWQQAEALTSLLLAGENALSPAAQSVPRLQQALDRVRVGTQQLGEASQDALTRELSASERAGADAERVSWVAAVGALLLSIALSALLARSILEPLSRLKHGTREVAAGRFGHRLDATGHDELAQVARDFNSMTERLDELDRMKRDFVSKISHDLKTPLSSMQETNGVLLDELPGPLTSKQRRLLEIQQESAARLAGMLSKLLDLSRIEAGLEPDFQMLDIGQLIRSSVDRVSAARSESGVFVAFAEPASRQLVRADAEGLAQVLDNLIENALKFSPADGEVRVEVADVPPGSERVPAEHWSALRQRGLHDGALLISVIDQGPGVDDAEKARVFDRFFQAHAGRSVRGRGVGLGLTICQEIVGQHGGVIWVSDNTPHGAVFNVLLPGAVRVGGDASAPALAGAGEPPT